MNDLPLIDISDLDSGNTAQEARAIDALGRSFHEIGFSAILGHGIAPSTIESLRCQVVKYFQLPLHVKQRHRVEPHNYRGYIPLGFFSPNSAVGDCDQYEGYKLHLEIDQSDPICKECDLYAPNKWPAEQPGLKKAALDYWHECDRLTQTLLKALAAYLGLDQHHFITAFDKPLSNMTLLHYPPNKAGGFGIHPHKDTDVLTILAPDSAGGLFVRPKDSSDWIAAQTREDCLIVNVGDMLETWTGGYFVSTPHKVENSSGKDRYSFPYFAVPHYAQEIKPLSSARTADTDYATMHAGNVSSQIWRSNWPNADAIEKHLDPYTH